MGKRLFFQLGTNNWQREGEFAPGSGILHESHHAAYNRMQETRAYSVYPSTTQTSDDPLVRIFELNHEVPICESVSPVSSYRFHSMSDDEFDRYVDRLTSITRDAIAAAEEAEGMDVTMAVAHHCFLNPLVLARLNAEREAAGRSRFPILCFVHGTALKMFAHEQVGLDPEYPERFLTLMREEGVFSGAEKIESCAAISNEQLEKFADVFGDYPRDKMILSPNGYNLNVFTPNAAGDASRKEVLGRVELASAPNPVSRAPMSVAVDAEKVVVFCGKFADWKRLDALLEAASHYENDDAGKTVTLVIGSGPDSAVDRYHQLAYETLGLRNTYFLGPQPHAVIARLNAIADVGVYPSESEPFGLVLIEAMGCGTPVIGADSGGPKDFVTQETGALVPESADRAIFVESLTRTVREALAEDWKHTKGPEAFRYASSNFSIDSQCQGIIDAVLKNTLD